jgi:hypothetical protein
MEDTSKLDKNPTLKSFSRDDIVDFLNKLPPPKDTTELKDNIIELTNLLIDKKYTLYDDIKLFEYKEIWRLHLTDKIDVAFFVSSRGMKFEISKLLRKKTEKIDISIAEYYGGEDTLNKLIAELLTGLFHKYPYIDDYHKTILLKILGFKNVNVIKVFTDKPYKELGDFLVKLYNNMPIEDKRTYYRALCFCIYEKDDQVYCRRQIFIEDIPKLLDILELSYNNYENLNLTIEEELLMVI